MKRFLEWIQLKEVLDDTKYPPPQVSEGDIWWASIGENVGREINGKSKLFSRPVLIFKKLSNELYFVIPITSQPKTGTWYTPVHYLDRKFYACLHQARALDYRRLSSRLSQIDENNCMLIKKSFESLYI